MTKDLTAGFAERVKVEKRTDFYDTKLTGFVLRVTENGKKTWAVAYRHQGQNRRVTLGTFPVLNATEARKAARIALRDAQLGTDPATAKQETRITFGDLSTLYLTGHAKEKKRSWKEDERMIEKDLLPAWKNRPAAEVTGRDVIAVVDRIVARGAGISANRTLVLISKIFNHGIGRQVVTSNPAFKIPKPAAEHARERTLSDAEIKRLWKVLDSQPNKKLAGHFKLALLTGQRAREVLKMGVAEIDFEKKTWTKMSGRNKNKGIHLVPLELMAMNLIEGLKRDDSAFIFPSNRIKDQPLDDYEDGMDKVRVLADLNAPAGDPLHFTFHDLRRTMTTNLGKLGVSRFIQDRVTNHADSTIGGRYDQHEYLAEKRAALALWEKALAEIVSETGTGASDSMPPLC
jgi:integrase